MGVDVRRWDVIGKEGLARKMRWLGEGNFDLFGFIFRSWRIKL